MARRNYTQNTQYLNRDTVRLEGRFLANGGSAIAQNATNIIGNGFTVTRAGTGLYTITFCDKFVALVSFKCTPHVATAAVRTPQVAAINLASKTIQVRTVDETGTAADLAANDGLSFEAVFWNTQQKPTFGIGA